MVFACLAAIFVLLFACFKLHASCSAWCHVLCIFLLIGAVCVLCSLFCSAALCFLGAPGFIRLSQSLTHSLTVSCTQTHMFDKRVFLNILSSVSILLSAFLQSASQRHFIFLLQTPADRGFFIFVSAFSPVLFSINTFSSFYKIPFLIERVCFSPLPWVGGVVF